MTQRAIERITAIEVDPETGKIHDLRWPDIHDEPLIAADVARTDHTLTPIADQAPYTHRLHVERWPGWNYADGVNPHADFLIAFAEAQT